jgi:hypothetical protein
MSNKQGDAYYYMDEEDKRKNRVKVFVRDASPGNWRDCANELRDAAELLWIDRDNGLRLIMTQDTEVDDGRLSKNHNQRTISSVSRSYLLLAGFALENLIKGYLVAKSPSLINTGKIDPELKTHKITSLIKKIDNIDLNQIEKDFCCVAEQAIPYWGRYPIPLKYNGVVPEIGLTDDLRYGFLSLFQRLDKMVYTEIRDGWDSGVGPTEWVYSSEYDGKERAKQINRIFKSINSAGAPGPEET